MKKDKEPVRLHPYILRISDYSEEEEKKVFEIRIAIPRINFRFLKSLLDLFEKYDGR